MDNNELAELFTDSVNSLKQPVDLDYRDRAVELALYFNETISDEHDSEYVIEQIRWAMMLAYSHRYGIDLVKLGREENDSNAQPATVRATDIRDPERTEAS